jgi:adenylate kinase
MIIILFGAPGVGKGTQATILADKLGVAHLSTGDAFRAAIKNQTEVGKIAKSYVDAGDLVPDDIVARIVEEAMAAPSFDNGCILDGFPRTKGQADALAAMLTVKGQAVHRVVNLEVDDANRLDVYRQETAPLLEYYTASGNLVSVNGVGSVEEISDRILEAIR